MKQEIMTKLFDGKELTTEELVYVGKNLTSDNTPIPYDHDNKSSLAACGLEESDITRINEKMRKLITEDELNVSRIIEEIEAMAISDDKVMRMVVYQAVKKGADKVTSLGSILGSGTIDGDFLPHDILKEIMKKIIKKRKDDEDNPEK